MPEALHHGDADGGEDEHDVDDSLPHHAGFGVAGRAEGLEVPAHRRSPLRVVGRGVDALALGQQRREGVVRADLLPPVRPRRGRAGGTAATAIGWLVGPVLAQQQWTPGDLMKVKRVSDVHVSPDGKRVVFAVRQAMLDGGASEYLTHVHIVNADGSGSRQLTKGESCEIPQWSPDGKWIAYLSQSGRRNIWLMAPDGVESHQLTHIKTGVSSFSPGFN